MYIWFLSRYIKPVFTILLSFEPHHDSFFFFFWFSLTSLSRLLQLIWDGPISRWGENGRTPRKTTWHTRKQNLACLTCGQSRARTLTRHSGEMIEWLRKSALNHSATGAIRIMRKQDFCLWENKGTDQLRSNCEADQPLCFCYTNSTISLLKSEILSSSLLLRLYRPVCVRPGRKPWRTVFSHRSSFNWLPNWMHK